MSLLIVIISFIFPENLSIYQWNLSSLSENMNCYIFDFNYLRQFHGLFYLYLITNDVSIYKITSLGFWPWIISDMLFKNCIKLHLYWISSSFNMNIGSGGEGGGRGGGCHTDTSRMNHLQRAQPKSHKTQSLLEDPIIVHIYGFYLIL